VTGRRSDRTSLWLWAVAAVGSAALLAVAIIGREQGAGATLRPMAASESMSDQEARAATDNTVRVYEREFAARHTANVEALTCPNPQPNSMLATDLNEVKRHLAPLNATAVIATGAFTRNGPIWLLNTFFSNSGGVVFELHVRDGELLVCGINRAPTL
jgi:hypothetical protein